jgi:Zn2+/Cd2+-exporting ATPase
MDCRNEEAAIRSRLSQVSQVGSLSFDLPARRLLVEHQLPDPQPLLQALTEIGMSASLEADGPGADGAACGSACSSACSGSKSVPSTDVFTIPDMDCRVSSRWTG